MKHKVSAIMLIASLEAMSVFAQTNKVQVAPKPKFHEIEINGIAGFQDTPMEPSGRWHVHDPTRPQPPVVKPGAFSAMASPPSDAIVLFNGKDLAQWIDSQGNLAPWVGVLMLGENGYTFGDPWKGAEYIKLKDDKKVSSILTHAVNSGIPQTLPRSPGHLKEWVIACGGGPPTFSSFEAGGHLTEIALSGVVALRAQKTLAWDGEKMCAKDAPEAQQFIQPHYRTGWTI